MFLVRKKYFCVALLMSWLWCVLGASGAPIVVGSKRFNESYILAEMMSQLLEDRGYSVDRRFGLGGTLVCFEALAQGELDVYPEYSGTIAQAILKLSEPISYAALQDRIHHQHNLGLLDSFGFNNTYAIAVRPALAEERKLSRVSDLSSHTDLRYGFTHEFISRRDGWPGLARTYGLRGSPTGIDHALAYQAMADSSLDVMDVYSTDADIDEFNLVLLEDDRAYFPTYLAAPLVGASVDSDVRAVLAELAGLLSDQQMRSLNGEVVLGGKTFADAAHGFLAERGLLSRNGHQGMGPGYWSTMWRRTKTHLALTFTALVAALLVALPLGIFVHRFGAVSKPIVYVAGVAQTVPSIALLALMIPLLGIGTKPAVVALFAYAVLPILRNTVSALESIDPVLRKVSTAMGMTWWQRVRYIELPLGTPTILAGIRTAAVINIGTATLAAFIGAGGLGDPIVMGLALRRTDLILEGAIPAALLAIIVELGFEALERVLVPRHLLQKQAV